MKTGCAVAVRNPALMLENFLREWENKKACELENLRAVNRVMTRIMLGSWNEKRGACDGRAGDHVAVL